MKLKAIIAGLVLSSTVSSASDYINPKLSLMQKDVIVPILNGDPAGADLVSGMIYFNNITDTFYGVDAFGAKVTLGTSGGGVPVTSSNTDRIERARITCSGSSNKNGATWISSVANVDGSGGCLVTFATPFASAPVCVFNVVTGAGNATFANVTSISTSTVTLQCRTTSAACTNNDFELICQGAL